MTAMVCPQPPHIPAGVIEHPADKAGAVKGGGGAAASEHIRVAQILLRLLQHGGKGLIPDGVTHCGIYVGNHMMLHCGDPISYTNLNNPYWQDHFCRPGLEPCKCT